MERKKENKVLEKRRSKIVAFNLSQDVISKFNDKVGYNFRSKTVDNLISNFVNKKKERLSPQRNPGGKSS